jgi:hypothetical protein
MMPRSADICIKAQKTLLFASFMNGLRTGSIVQTLFTAWLADIPGVDRSSMDVSSARCASNAGTSGLPRLAQPNQWRGEYRE